MSWVTASSEFTRQRKQMKKYVQTKDMAQEAKKYQLNGKNIQIRARQWTVKIIALHNTNGERERDGTRKHPEIDGKIVL